MIRSGGNGVAHWIGFWSTSRAGFAASALGRDFLGMRMAVGSIGAIHSIGAIGSVRAIGFSGVESIRANMGCHCRKSWKLLLI